MHSARWLKSSLILLLLPLLYLPTGAEQVYSPPRSLQQPKASPVISSRARSYLQSKATAGTVAVWVYFTDKGLITAEAFTESARSARESFTAKALARRLKNGAEQAGFEDLPVSRSYIQQIGHFGLKLRRVSKWLNAASFDATMTQLEAISALPFVRQISPVAGFAKPAEPAPTPGHEFKSEGSQRILDGQTLDYGLSEPQLSQIGVVEAHDSGYSAAGVWVASFDTGFRKSHTAFSAILSSGRLIAEHDFVFNDNETANQPADLPSAWDHGTATWSTLGGTWPGNLYGPAYGASFVLCKTEDVRSETQVEEDNWVAAMEWVDSIGVDVISSSLAYSDWYTSSDYNGDYCVTTVAADIAAAHGIVVCNAAGNSGPLASTLSAPADADSIVTVGAVNSSGTIAGFSSRGPTADGRTKPEVCACGVNTYCAGSGGNTQLTTASGTSLSCPLAAGVAALTIGAHPDWTAMQVREAMMVTASRAATPDNTYGWGILNVMAAIHHVFEPPYMQGDPNEDGKFNLSDAVYIINYIFTPGSPAPIPVLLAGDANDDGSVNVSDATFLINYVFVPGSPPPPGWNH